MYNLFLDIGNTSIAMALYEYETLTETGRMPSDPTLSPDAYYTFIVSFLKPFNIQISEINDLVIASVVPALTETLSILWQTHEKKDPFIIHAGLKTNLQIELDDPSELGTDLLAGAVAAYAENPNTTTIIVDMGTATTMTIITKAGQFRGASIVTGLELMLRALIDNTALLSLPDNFARGDVKAIGVSTETAIESGIVYGYTGLVDNIIANMIHELETDDYKIITTGGQAPLIATRSKFLTNYEPNLIFKGMQIIYQKNNKND